MVFGRGAHWGFQLPVVFYFRKKRGKLGEILRCDEAVESTWVLLYIYVYISVHLKYFERNKGRGKRKRDWDPTGCRMLDRLVARNNAELNS